MNKTAKPSKINEVKRSRNEWHITFRPKKGDGWFRVYVKAKTPEEAIHRVDWTSLP